MKGLVTGLGILMLLLGPVGCDSGDDGATCSSVGKAICARACECGGEKCTVEGEGMMTISFDSKEDCEALYVGIGCMGGGASDFDWDACALAFSESQCGDDGVVYPAECLEEEQ
jgi:hypothetical protein